jgi:hypothetical protein
MKYADAAEKARNAGIDADGPIVDIIDFFYDLLWHDNQSIDADRQEEIADRWAFKYDAGDKR